MTLEGGPRTVLVVQPIHQRGMELLSRVAQVRIASDTSPEALAHEVEDVDGILVRTAPLPAAVINAASQLRIIARHGVGVDNIDVAAATQRKIPVAYTPHANAVSVAEHVLALMLALAKQVIPYDRATREGRWEVRNSYQAVDLQGKTLGVVGIGRIGRVVAQKARTALDMVVLGFDPYIDSETIESLAAEPVDSLETLLEASDVVSVHVPLGPETKGLINASALERMKPSAFLINASRGDVVDEPALLEALKSRRIAAAGLDVFSEEPAPASNPIFQLPNVVVSPHSAALTEECVIRMATGSAQAIVDVLEGRRPEDVVNPEVFA